MWEKNYIESVGGYAFFFATRLKMCQSSSSLENRTALRYCNEVKSKLNSENNNTIRVGYFIWMCIHFS
jgi:hypothetical protein